MEGQTRPVNALFLLQAQLAAKDLQLQQQDERLVSCLPSSDCGVMHASGCSKVILTATVDVWNVSLQGITQTAYAESRSDLASSKANLHRSTTSLVSAWC